MSRSAGRPRKRTIEESLDLAMDLFWRQGFEATSVQDLCEALGVGPSSIYNSFGSKAQLYLQCLERYIETNAELGQTLNKESAYEAIVSLLKPERHLLHSPRRAARLRVALRAAFRGPEALRDR